MFKVVADQLKVSQGWVRCGHCSEVFDASLHLQATPASSSPPEPALQQPYPQGYAQQPGSFDQGLPTTTSEDNYLQPEPAGQQDESWTPGVFFVEPSAQQPSPAAAEISRQEANAYGPGDASPVMHQNLHFDESPVRDADEYGEAVRVMAAEARAVDGDENHSTPLYMEDSVRGDLGSDPEAPHDVSFVRDARRKALWRRPVVRAVLVMCSVLLGFALLLQVLVQQRDQVAALRPDLKPVLQTLCEQLHCDVGPVRKIESVVIDSSSFNRMDADSFRLSFSLKNTGGTPVAMPSLEVTLTDMQEQAVIRRVLTPAQFGAPGAMLASGSDFTGFVVMQILAAEAANSAGGSSVSGGNSPRVAGYRLLAFYP